MSDFGGVCACRCVFVCLCLCMAGRGGDQCSEEEEFFLQLRGYKTEISVSAPPKIVDSVRSLSEEALQHFFAPLLHFFFSPLRAPVNLIFLSVSINPLVILRLCSILDFPMLHCMGKQFKSRLPDVTKKKFSRGKTNVIF